MNHTIEFLSDFLVDLDTSGSNRMEQMRVSKGTRFEVWLKPYVVRSGSCPIEVADLYLDNGTVIRSVPFGFFFFVE